MRSQTRHCPAAVMVGGAVAPNKRSTTATVGRVSAAHISAAMRYRARRRRARDRRRPVGNAATAVSPASDQQTYFPHDGVVAVLGGSGISPARKPKPSPTSKQATASITATVTTNTATRTPRISATRASHCSNSSGDWAVQNGSSAILALPKEHTHHGHDRDQPQEEENRSGNKPPTSARN